MQRRPVPMQKYKSVLKKSGLSDLLAVVVAEMWNWVCCYCGWMFHPVMRDEGVELTDWYVARENRRSLSLINTSPSSHMEEWRYGSMHY